MAPKLTSQHINLGPFLSMKVKFATQVLSHAVACAFATYSAMGLLD